MRKRKPESQICTCYCRDCWLGPTPADEMGRKERMTERQTDRQTKKTESCFLGENGRKEERGEWVELVS